MSGEFLSIRNLQKSFGEVKAVNDVTLDIRQGEFLTFLGPSGSGKSSTLYAIAGLDMPTSGDVRINGASILQTPPHKRNIGMVFQRYTLFPHLKVRENIAFPLRVRGWAKPEIDSRVEQMLTLTRLTGLGERLPAQLSGGQQQRVALARALAYDPPVLLMDEPLSALDKKLRDELQVEIRRIHHQTGVTILYVTHDQEEALRLSDRIAVFNRGNIEQVGKGEDLYRTPATRFVAGFIGDSNFFQVQDVVSRDPTHALIVMPDGTRFDQVPVHHDTGGANAELMVRPQAIRVVGAEAPGLNVSVVDVTFLGDSVAALLKSAWGQELWMRLPAAASVAMAPGMKLRIGWNTQESHLFTR
jgi:putative spermidine/putrescine transport system ATP-binding protein